MKRHSVWTNAVAAERLTQLRERQLTADMRRREMHCWPWRPGRRTASFRRSAEDRDPQACFKLPAQLLRSSFVPNQRRSLGPVQGDQRPCPSRSRCLIVDPWESETNRSRQGCNHRCMGCSMVRSTSCAIRDGGAGSAIVMWCRPRTSTFVAASGPDATGRH